MSREPTNPLHQGWHAFDEPPAPPKSKKKPRSFRVVVEPSKKEREQALNKMATSTEALTPEERKIIAGYRLSVGGPAAEAERRRIEQRIRRGKP